MNIAERIIKINYEHTGDDVEINDLLITVITKFQLFEPCRYLSEDEQWLNVAIISPEDNSISQALSIRKNEITTFGVFNREEIELNFTPPMEADDLYQ